MSVAGYDMYLDQYPCLYNKLMEKQEIRVTKIPGYEVQILDFDMVDNSINAFQYVKESEAANLDFIFYRFDN